MGMFIDLTGQRFGRLVVVSRVENGARRDARWLVKCDCGTEKVASGTNLRKGVVQSCGCLRRGWFDLTGQHFGRLTVIERGPNISYENGRSVVATWVCVCECGNRVTVRGRNLRSGTAQSCGCLRRERGIASNTTHGMTHSSEYQTYVSAKARCTNPKDQAWMNYGGRGIEFRFNSFEEFFAEVGPKPEPKRQYSLDRIDVNGNYEPGNVKWATRSEQNHNKRSIRKLQAERDRLREVLKRRDGVLIDLIIDRAVRSAR
jgi:hypothetical protein